MPTPFHTKREKKNKKDKIITNTADNFPGFSFNGINSHNLKPHELEQHRHHLHFLRVFSVRNMSYFNSYPSSSFFLLVLLFTAAVALSLFLSDSSSATEAALSSLQLAVSTSYSICRAIFAGGAYFLAFVINGLRVPSEALHSALQQLAEVIRSLANYLVGLVVDVVSSLVSFVLELAKEAAGKFVELATEGATAFAEKGREGIEALCKVAVEVVRIMAEALAGAVAQILNSFKEVVNSVMGKGE